MENYNLDPMGSNQPNGSWNAGQSDQPNGGWNAGQSNQPNGGWNASQSDQPSGSWNAGQSDQPSGSWNTGQSNQQWQANQPNPQWQSNQQWQPNQQWQQEPEKQGLAIASLVLGILSILCCYFYAGILGIVGLVLGIVSLAKKRGGKGMAIAGVITSAIGTVILIIQIVAVVLVIGWGLEESGMTMDEFIYELEKEVESDYDYDFNEAANGIEDFEGKSYEGGDGSVIYFEEDGTYTWYQDDADHSDNYYAGTYELYFGEEAVEYIVDELAEYAVTQEEMDDYFERNADSDFFTEDNCVCMMLYAKEAIIDGEDQADGGYTSPYMGFMQDGYFDATNMRTANYVAFYERTE